MIVCLAGMGRSGTSLIASYFKHCGINMGERLLGARFNNPRGHFEDQDFLDFHKALLVENRADMFSPKKDMIVSDEMRDRAKSIIASHSKLGETWGWKEPRTSLFLDLWGEMLPDAKFVFMYRDAYANMESLYKTIHKHYIYLTPWVVPGAWSHYNQKCLAFHKMYPDRSVFVSIEGLNASHEHATTVLGDWLSYDFKLPYTDIYHAQDMSCGKKDLKRFPVNLYIPLIKSLYGTSIDKLAHELDRVALIPRSGV